MADVLWQTRYRGTGEEGRVYEIVLSADASNWEAFALHDDGSRSLVPAVTRSPRTLVAAARTAERHERTVRRAESVNDAFGFEAEETAVERLARRLAEADLRLVHDLTLVRTHRNMTQAELGRRLGMSATAVDDFENSRTIPTTATVRRVASALGVLIEHTIIDASGADGTPQAATGLACAAKAAAS